MASEYLKDTYKPQLWAILVFNLIVFWAVIISHADLSTLGASLDGISVRDGLLGAIVPILAFVLDALWSSLAKARIVYWHWRHPLPGSHAFSVHLKAEHRANPERLMKKWGNFPEDPIAQNRLWYQIYESFSGDTRVREAHRAWLFSRDLTALALLFLCFFGVTAFFSDASWTTSSLYVAALAVQYATTMIAARIQGIRFVLQVLVVASQPRQEDVRST